jgi:hypothetical protein
MFALLAVGGILGSAASPFLLRRISPRLLVLGSVWRWGIIVALLILSRPPYPAKHPTGCSGASRPSTRNSPSASAPFLLTGYLPEWIGGRATTAAIGGWALLAAAASTLSAALRHHPPQPGHAKRPNRCVLTDTSRIAFNVALPPI